MPARRTPAATAELRAALIDRARHLIRRDGAEALTMRALAAEAGCSVGLPYTVFANRDELVVELVRDELARVREQLTTWIAAAGRRSVAVNLDRYAAILLDTDTPALALARSFADRSVDAAVIASAHEAGLVHSLDTAVADYLAAEQRLGRVDGEIDVDAFGFLITGAVHNLVEAGAAYPRPDRRRLRRYLSAVAATLAPRPPPRDAAARDA